MLKFPADAFLHPSEVLLQWMERNHISQKALAASTTLSPALISMLLNRKRNMSTGIVSLIAAATNTKEEAWQQHIKAHEEWSLNADKPVEGIRSILTGILSNQDIRFAREMGAIRISDLAEENIMQSSVDLTLEGSKRLPLPPWLAAPQAAKTLVVGSVPDADAEVRKERHLIIGPGESWLTWARQTVWLDRAFCGRIGGRSDLTIAGVHMLFGTQVNSGWEGQPFATLYNPTGKPFELEPGQPFMTLEIHRLSSPAVLTPTEEGGAT